MAEAEPSALLSAPSMRQAPRAVADRGGDALAQYGAFVLRCAIGIDWVAHALLKPYRGMETHAALLAKNGIWPQLAWPTFGIELLGGVMIILGIYSRYWATLLTVFLLTVVWIKWPVGWLYSYSGGGWEYPLFWGFVQSAYVLVGEGAFALYPAPLPIAARWRCF
jgi:putative oxidoreductase